MRSINLIWFYCNHDHIFFDSSKDYLAELVDEMKNEELCSLQFSHWPENIRTSKNNPKYKESYQEFQKCLGVDVNNNSIDSTKIYIVGKLTLLNNGKYSILSPSMSKLFKSKLNPGYLGVDSGFLRKGIKQDDKNSFLSCIADILTCDKSNINLNPEKIK